MHEDTYTELASISIDTRLIGRNIRVTEKNGEVTVGTLTHVMDKSFRLLVYKDDLKEQGCWFPLCPQSKGDFTYELCQN